VGRWGSSSSGIISAFVGVNSHWEFFCAKVEGCGGTMARWLLLGAGIAGIIQGLLLHSMYYGSTWPPAWLVHCGLALSCTSLFFFLPFFCVS
jgi:hypothetical protein